MRLKIEQVTTLLLISLVSAGSALAEDKNLAHATADGDPNKAGRHKSSRDHDDEDKPWMHTIPLDKKSQCGLPLGQLNHAALQQQSAEIGRILARSPRRPGDEAERKMWQATLFASQKRFEQADEAFSTLKNWTEFPCSVKTLMARSYAEEQKYKEAIEILTQVVAKEPSPDAYADRAGCYASLNKLLEAAHDYELASHLSSFSERGFLVKGANLLIKIGRTQEALTYLERAEKSHRTTPSAALSMVKANCYIKMGEKQKAVDSLNQAEQIAALGKTRFGSDTDVMLPTILSTRANLYREMGKIDLARKDRQKLDSMTNKLLDDIGGDSDKKKFRK